MNGTLSTAGDDWLDDDPASTARNATIVYIYPTVSPETVWVPIVCCIAAFPALVLTVVLLLRHRAIRARARSRITRKRDAVRYSQASNKFCKVKLQNYDGLETVESREGNGPIADTRMNGSYTVSTDLATAVERSIDGEMSTFDLVGIVAGGRQRAATTTDDDDDDDDGADGSDAGHF